MGRGKVLPGTGQLDLRYCEKSQNMRIPTRHTKKLHVNTAVRNKLRMNTAVLLYMGGCMDGWGAVCTAVVLLYVVGAFILVRHWCCSVPIANYTVAYQRILLIRCCCAYCCAVLVHGEWVWVWVNGWVYWLSGWMGFSWVSMGEFVYRPS